MAVDTTPPPTGARGSSKGLVGWAKKNKLAAGGIAAGAGFLFLSKKGGGGGGSALVSDGTPATSPLSDVSNYGPDESTGDGSGGEQGTGTGIPSDPATPTTPDDLNDTPDPADAAPTPITVVVQSPARPEDVGEPAAPSPSLAETATTQQGVTLAGHFFPGATGSTMTGSGSNEYGKYMIHKVSFPGRVEYWWHYTSGSASGKWTGPHTAASGSAAAAPQHAAPTVTIVSTTAHPGAAATGGGSGSSGGGGGAAQPIAQANVFYNADRKLRYIIQNKKTTNYPKGHNFRGYESKLNKGDWGSSAGPGWIPT